MWSERIGNNGAQRRCLSMSLGYVRIAGPTLEAGYDQSTEGTGGRTPVPPGKLRWLVLACPDFSLGEVWQIDLHEGRAGIDRSSATLSICRRSPVVREAEAARFGNFLLFLTGKSPFWGNGCVMIREGQGRERRRKARSQQTPIPQRDRRETDRFQRTGIRLIVENRWRDRAVCPYRFTPGPQRTTRLIGRDDFGAIAPSCDVVRRVFSDPGESVGQASISRQAWPPTPFLVMDRSGQFIEF